jgi:hypothetical protein
MSFVEALGPPVEEGSRADERWLGLERHTALGLRFLQVLDGGEMAVDQWRVGERPEVFSWLHFWRIRWQEVQGDGIGDA